MAFSVRRMLTFRNNSQSPLRQFRISITGMGKKSKLSVSSFGFTVLATPIRGPLIDIVTEQPQTRGKYNSSHFTECTFRGADFESFR